MIHWSWLILGIIAGFAAGELFYAALIKAIEDEEDNWRE